jgi:hypothetical protein
LKKKYQIAGKKQMSPEEKSIKMTALADQWHQSGMTQTLYALENNISVHKLKYWLYKKRKPEAISGDFIQLKDFPFCQDFVIRYPNGVEIKINANTPIPVIKSLVNL